MTEQPDIDAAAEVVAGFVCDPGTILMPDDSLCGEILDAVEMMHNHYITQRARERRNAAVMQSTPTNCFRACVATVLGMTIDQVPESCDGAKWDWDDFERWLAGLGLQAVEMTFANGGTLYPVQKPVRCILTGPSPRECTTGQHAVVADFIGMDGFNLIHDPHESQEWISGEPTHATFFVPLDISEMLQQRSRERAEADERSKPVTEEWIIYLNPPRYWEAGREYSWPTVGLRYAVELVGVSGVGEPGFYIDGRYEPLFLKHITTRGQVLDLLRALGVETKTRGCETVTINQPDISPLAAAGRKANEAVRKAQKIVDGLHDSETQPDIDAAAEIERLREELVEHLETILHNEGRLRQESENLPLWWDTCASSDAACAGERLTELGFYERHPDGYGRRQFYRKITQLRATIDGLRGNNTGGK